MSVVGALACLLFFGILGWDVSFQRFQQGLLIE